MSKSAEKRYGLVLTLGNAPSTPHRIPDVPGFFYFHTPTPVGGPGEISLEDAKRYDAGSEELALVEIPAGEVKAAERKAAETLAEVRNALVDNRQTRPRGGDAVQHRDEQQALADAEALAAKAKHDEADEAEGGKA